MRPLPKLYNTLTRKAEPLALRDPGKVAIYCCGPTVYDVPHVGHARAALAPDVLVRWLEQKQLEITYVRNLTDVDDKILARAAQKGEPPLELSLRMAEIYQRTMLTLGCLPPNFEPKVSQHIPEIILLIGELIAKEAAYVVDMPGGTRDVYFAVRRFTGYGKLSGRRVDELVVGARVRADENKQDPLDFALWKGAPAGELGWESPWGHGRPGWHIECSAMSCHYLRHGFDVHAGGMDLIFPHHENEIAQSEAACPQCGPLARVWLHNGFVNVDQEKMSKSLGNFVTVDDVLARNDPEAFRWFLLAVHYRGPIQFDTAVLPDGRVIFPGVEEAEGRVDYLYDTVERLISLGEQADASPEDALPEWARLGPKVLEAERKFASALDDDLNTPVALAELGELCKLANELGDLAIKHKGAAAKRGAFGAAARRVLGALRETTAVLGLLQAGLGDYRLRTRRRRAELGGLSVDEVDQKVRARAEARKKKDFERADALRKELGALGVEVMDSPEGSSWSIGPVRAKAS